MSLERLRPQHIFDWPLVVGLIGASILAPIAAGLQMLLSETLQDLRGRFAR